MWTFVFFLSYQLNPMKWNCPWWGGGEGWCGSGSNFF